METKLARIAQLSRENPHMAFTSIGHLINVEMLKECHGKDPQILILDEPLSALDADSVEMAREQIAKERERGKLILLASHYAEDIQVLCDVVYKMDGGRCQ